LEVFQEQVRQPFAYEVSRRLSAITRDSWIEAAKQVGSPFVEIELICSDIEEHRRRVEMREPDIEGHAIPTWHDVVSRDYDPWTCNHIVIDTAKLSASQATGELIRQLSDIALHPA
jgi:predicted kinase